MRSRLKSLGGILAAVGPLVFVWAVSHLRHPPLREPLRSDSVPARPPAPAAAPASLPAPREGIVTGAVMDGESRPLPDAPVTLVDPEGRGDVLAPGRAREIRDRETRTDDRGEFRFAGLRPGRFLLIARPAGRPSAWTEPFLLEGAAHHVLRVPAPVSLTGLTHPRAKLSFACRIPGLPSPGHRPVTVAGTADDAGGYRVDGLPPSVTFVAQVEAEGYRPRSFGPYQFPPGRHFLDFDLETGLTLKGIVRDGAGRPVAGALAVYDDARARTGADGSFALAGLEERSTTLIVSREGHVQTALPSIRPGSVEVTLPRSAEVTGRVAGGRGRYLCFTVGDARYRLGMGESDTFRIPSVPPGALRLDVEDEARRILGSTIIRVPEGGCVEGVEILLR